MSKKFVFLSIVLVLLAAILVVPGNIKAQTATEIQNQINQLLAQVTQLQAQLAQLNSQQYSYYNQQYPYNQYNQAYQNIPAGFTFTQNLYLGTVSQDVAYLRQVLIQDGCLSSSYGGTSQYFDSILQSAVMCFQNKHNSEIYALVGYRVTLSGNVGPGTRAGLNNLIANNYNNYGYNNYNYSYYPYSGSNYNYQNYSGNLTASCYASPSSIQTGQAANFIATASGGNGYYTYSWSGACTGGTSSCYNIISTSGSQTAYLAVTSGGQTVNTSCSINAGGYNSGSNSNISCVASPSTVRAGQPVNFTVASPAGTYINSYSWTGACTSSNSVCYTTLPNIGNHNATVAVYANGQYTTANCSVYVNSY